MAITSASNYQRFCSSFMADGSVGFRRPILFTNEEATDFVSPPPLQAWPATPGNQRQAGLVVAQDARNGKTVDIPGMGRMNHENTIFVPGGWDKLVAVTGDDTFSAPSSQFYMYVADSDHDVLADKGSLYAFVAENPTINDYGDITSGMSVSGHFIPVPRDIAVGDQTPLENWSNANNVFQFIRIEDLDYVRHNPRIVYFADTGEPRAIPDPATGRLRRGPSGTQGPYPNGRIFKMEFNAKDPMTVDSLSILGSRVEVRGRSVIVDVVGAIYSNVDVTSNIPENCCFIIGMPNVMTKMIANAPIIAMTTLRESFVRFMALFLNLFAGTETSTFWAYANMLSIAAIRASISV